jgi:hypothetical protein
VRLRRASNSASQSSMLTGWELLLQEQPSQDVFVSHGMIGQVCDVVARCGMRLWR